MKKLLEFLGINIFVNRIRAAYIRDRLFIIDCYSNPDYFMKSLIYILQEDDIMVALKHRNQHLLCNL